MSARTVGELQIAVVGRRKVGKSLLVNRIISNETSIIDESSDSDNEPLRKVVKLLPSIPSVTISIASIEKQNGDRRKKTNKCIKAVTNADFALLVLDAREGLNECETYLITYLSENEIPFLVAVNKIEFGTNPHLLIELEALDVMYFEISCKENAGLESMKKKMIRLLPVKTDLQ